MVSLALRGSAEVSIGEDNWSHKGPGIEEEADPAGADLDPHSWPLAGNILELRIRAKKQKKVRKRSLIPASDSPPNKARKFSRETWLTLILTKVPEGT